MLLRFGVSNHRSIRDYQELFLSASKRIKRQRLTFPLPILREEAIPIVSIFGPNASGKSNLLDAMDELQRLILRSHVKLGAADHIPHYPFALSKVKDRPTQLDCTFCIDYSVSGESENIYEYGFEYTATEFKKEWLYRIVRKERQSTQVLFERVTSDAQVRVDFGAQLRGENKTISNLTRPNSLFLSAAAQNNHPQLTSIYNYFSSSWNIFLGPAIMNDLSLAGRLSDFDHMSSLVNLIRQADLGITDIDIEEKEADEEVLEMIEDVFGAMAKHIVPPDRTDSFKKLAVAQLRESKQLRFIHSSGEEKSQPFDYGMESKGTRTLISLLIPALEALAKGAVLIIDELDTSLHPVLSRALVSLFDRGESNPNGAQLIFTTHDISLLSSGLLYQDEICISEKDHNGVSRFTPLTEFKLRSRENVERAYRGGRLGGVPFSNDFFINIGHEPRLKNDETR